MSARSDIHLSRRERQIMDIVYRRGQASAAEVHADLTDRPSYSAVRAMLRILEEKGLLKHTKTGNKYIYLPMRSRKDAGKSAVRRLLRTFFDGSAEKAVVALLGASDIKISEEQLDRLMELIRKADSEER
ncbi:MAG: BlaI/MecI/CopY family transcriptional regulator [Planctomycetota bacterium]|nr:BlaI/MecI/CopY family transcriptional regulator [Planctomycetota bacterium]